MNALYIKKIKLVNFRKFEDIDVELNDEKTILVGKNNTGKTSLIKSVEIFESKKLNSTDVNVNLIKKIVDKILNDIDNLSDEEISLEIILKYNENCDFNIVEKYMNEIAVDGEIRIKYQYKIFNDKIQFYKGKLNSLENGKEKYIQNNIKNMLEYKFFLNGKEQNEIIKVSNILNMNYICANRKVDNDITSKTNSASTQKVLDNGIKELKENETLRDIIINAEIASNVILNDDAFFVDFKNKIKTLKGLLGEDKPNIDMDYSSILEKPKVNLTFNKKGIAIPEYNSGLGYANFYSLLLNIISFIENINKNNIKNSFLIIEEPEAYTHPQMQYIFNENIENLLNKSLNNGLQIQYVIVTHSPQIVTTSQESDIIIFRESNNMINYTKFSELIESDVKFFKQYFKLTNSELLFADKVIFLEGDTEEILIKEIFEKFDEETKFQKEQFYKNIREEKTSEEYLNQKKYYEEYIPLMKQNISILPVSTQANKFQTIVGKLGIKTLIITDIDFVKKNNNNKYIKSTYDDSEDTSNPTIKEMILNNQEITFEEYKSDVNNWKEDSIFQCNDIAISHQIKIKYQLDVNQSIEYYPRTFEDSFLITNYNLIKNNKDLKKLYADEEKIFDEDLFIDKEKYKETLLKVRGKTKYKKAGLAFELLVTDDKWEIPQYIKRGLKWLQGK